MIMMNDLKSFQRRIMAILFHIEMRNNFFFSFLKKNTQRNTILTSKEEKIDHSAFIPFSYVNVLFKILGSLSPYSFCSFGRRMVGIPIEFILIKTV